MALPAFRTPRASTSLTLGTAAFVASAVLVWTACGTSASSGTSDADGGGSSSGAGGGSSSGSSSGGAAGSSSGASSSGSSSGSAGGSSSGASSSGSSSGGGSSGSSSGAGSDAGTCPSTPCAGGDTCCASVAQSAPECQGTCAAGNVVGCTVPADCAGSTDGGTECCATAVLADNPDGAAFPNCKIDSLTSYCGKCSTSITASCTATEKLHVCTATADCASDGNTECCKVLSYNICVNSLEAIAAGLTCLP